MFSIVLFTVLRDISRPPYFFFSRSGTSLYAAPQATSSATCSSLRVRLSFIAPNVINPESVEYVLYLSGLSYCRLWAAFHTSVECRIRFDVQGCFDFFLDPGCFFFSGLLPPFYECYLCHIFLLFGDYSPFGPVLVELHLSQQNFHATKVVNIFHILTFILSFYEI